MEQFKRDGARLLMQTEFGTRGPGRLADGDSVEMEAIQECEEQNLSPSLTSTQLWNLSQVSKTTATVAT